MAADAIEEIQRLYYKATAQTIERDLARAIELLKSLPDEATRETAAVYMDGLAQMRRDWQRPRTPGATKRPAGRARAGKAPDPRAAAGKPHAGKAQAAKAATPKKS